MKPNATFKTSNDSATIVPAANLKTTFDDSAAVVPASAMKKEDSSVVTEVATATMTKDLAITHGFKMANDSTKSNQSQVNSNAKLHQEGIHKMRLETTEWTKIFVPADWMSVSLIKRVQIVNNMKYLKAIIHKKAPEKKFISDPEVISYEFSIDMFEGAVSRKAMESLFEEINKGVGVIVDPEVMEKTMAALPIIEDKVYQERKHARYKWA